MHDTSFPDPPTFKPLFERLRREEEEIRKDERLKEKKEIAKVMLEHGYSAQEIIKMTRITEDELEEIKEHMGSD